MFEKFTEGARRAVFFARYEASQFGSTEIETYHLLLGIVRDDELLRTRVLGTRTLDALRAEFAHLAGSSKISTSVDLPLSQRGKRALAFAAEEAKIAGSDVIGGEHLLAGLLRERTPTADALEKRGITLQLVRKEFFGPPRVEDEIRLQELLKLVKLERLSAAIRILNALKSPQVTISVTTPTEQFTVSFPPDTTAASEK